MSYENYEEWEEGLEEDELEQDFDEVDYNLLRSLKKKYFDIYQVEIMGAIITFRSLSFKEFAELRDSFLEREEQEEEICKMAVLDPVFEDWSVELHGVIPQLLCRQIMFHSGLSPDSSDEIKKYRREQKMIMETSIEEQIACVIKEAFPTFELEEILSWSIKKMCWYEARALWLLKNMRGIEFEDTNELEELIEMEKMQAGG